ncbi:MAG TPA: hypothetical protein VK458_04000 [Myxococcaceae bacterium]|nr:hypothetical protein [Myxococcaceae bacterium]
MDEEKKSEAGGHEPERVGSYRLEAPVSQSRDGREGLYLATNETSGALALVLVLKSTFHKGVGALKQWRVRFIFSASEGYKALEAEETPYAVAADRQSAESLMSTLEAVAQAVRHMDEALPVFDRPRPGRRLGWGLAGAVAACALLFALVRLDAVCPRTSEPEPVASAEPEQLEPHSSSWLGNTMPPGAPVFARPLPRQPFKGQKRPPCTRLVEAELIGACWGPHELKAPCPDELFEHQGKCYAPIIIPQLPPQSLGQ